MKELIQFIAGSLLDGLDQVEVNEIEGNQTTVIELKIHPDNIGKIIGRQGRTANALRTIVNAAASKSGRRVVLEIIENKTGNDHIVSDH
jgi:uncharacterized protein